MIDLLKKHLETFAAGDWDGYKATFTEDAVYDEECTQRRVKGKGDIVRLVSAWKRAFPDIKAHVKSTFASGDTLIAELEWEGTHTGTLEGPFGSLSPTGRHGKVPAVQVIKFEDGKIRELRHYYDLMTVLQQAGLKMAPAGPQPTAP